MPDIALSETEGFHAWAKMLVENQDSYFIPEVKVLINFYNHDDSAYLVLDVYLDDVDFTQYVFIAANDEDNSKVTLMIFDLIRLMDFSLAKLLAWLATAEFLESPNGIKLEINGLHICRNRPKAESKFTKT